MGKIAPFHSKDIYNEVHHDDDTCAEGEGIEEHDRIPGSGGYPKCENCTRLSG